MNKDRKILLEKIADIYVSIGQARDKLQENTEQFAKLMEALKMWEHTMEASETQLTKFENEVIKLNKQLNDLEEENEN